MIGRLSQKIYVYDGSLMGFYSLVFACVSRRELPFGVEKWGDASMTLFAKTAIDTDEKKSLRVRTGLKRESPEALALVESVFFSQLKDKEIWMLKFLFLFYEKGKDVTSQISDPTVSTLIRARDRLYKEAELYTGFVRFAEYKGVLVGEISPENFVLPFLKEHFCQRFCAYSFFLYDNTHKVALVHKDKKGEIVPVERFTLAPESEEELHYQGLWKAFYKSVSIKERESEKRRMGQLPKRYWAHMTEMKDV